MKNFNNKKRGMSILGILILGIIVVLVLSYFKISIKTIVESPEGQDNIHYVTDNSKTVWEKYLKEPATYLWKEIWVKIFWTSFIDNMKKIKNGEPTDFEQFAPVAFPKE